MNVQSQFENRTRSSATLMRAGVVLAFVLTAIGAQGASNYVTSVAAMQMAINNSSIGDVIALANGTYLQNNITIGKSDITVRAVTPGGVFLNGNGGITITGSRVTFSGFQFISGTNSGSIIDVDGNQNLLTQLNFDGYTAQKYINIKAPRKSNEVAYCNFQNKPTNAVSGNLVHVGADASVVGYHKIRYCSFQDIPGPGGDFGNECIRLSNGVESTYIARTVVEYCYFNNTGGGDGEAISVKCRGNVLRYNTFTNNQDAMLTFRNGNDSVAYGNFFIGAGGIRVKEANNIFCYNNYFENSGVGGSKESVKLDYISPNCSNINFLHNTFVECGSIDLGGTGPETNTWANNIFKKSSGGIFTNPNLGTTWMGNIYSGTVGIAIPSGMTSANPQLVLNSDGYYGINSNSPAIDAASAGYPAIPDVTNVDDDFSLLLDISRQARPASVNLKDVGCDEYTTGGTLNRPLKLSDVGPSYLGGPGSATVPSITAQSSNQTVVAGSPVSMFVVASGTAPLSYQWRKNGTNLVGVTTATNTIASAQITDAASYTVVVTNVAGSITNTPATLTVNVPPSIAVQSSNQTVNAGAPVSLFVVASGTAPLTYLWRKDGTNIAVTTATNNIAAAQSPNAGSYTVVVTNIAGSSTSVVATLTVLITPPQITSIVPGVGGGFTLSGTGPAGETYRILATTNIELPLVIWPTVDTGVFAGGLFNFTDTQATNHLQRFYRIATP